MKITRRDFVKTGAIAGGGLLINKSLPSTFSIQNNLVPTKPIIVSTWDFGKRANEIAMKEILSGSNSLDAIEAGIRIIENDPEVNTVGYGGLPDETGTVTLDAAVMDWNGNAGSVAAIENIKNPISVAKLVMQKTDHVMLAGAGAKQFALENGFNEENLLTKESREKWLEWKEKFPNGEFRIDANKNHDTIGMLAIDKHGNLSGGVSTSGLAFKIHGRVGDSPVIGAALYVDNEVGGAVATGNGEFIMKALGSFLVVEKMREGFSPQEACKFAIKRTNKLIRNYPNNNYQIAFIALNKAGKHGTFALKEGFVLNITDSENSITASSDFLLK